MGVERRPSSVTTWQVYGLGGELVAEYDVTQNGGATQITASKEYGYRNGQLLITAAVPVVCNTCIVAEEGTGQSRPHWLVTDQLGTPRMVFDKTGTLANVKRHDYLPFGEELTANQGLRTTTLGYGAADGVRQKFTQKERDNETGLDYFLARYYSSTQGRFTSPDEFTGGPDELYDFTQDAADNPLFYADLAEPQSLNKYQYAYNNPLSFIDPDGHQGQGKKTITERLKEGAREVGRVAKETATGAASAILENNGFDGIDAPQNVVGRSIGDAASIVQGGVEVIGGVGMINGGAGGAVVTAPACATGVGCAAPAAGVGTVVVGVVVTVHGAAVIGNTLNNIFNKNSSGQQSSGESPGQTSAGRPTDQNGRPLGPSGKPTIHQNNFPTKKAAKDAARNAGQGTPMKHPSPRRGQPHFHPTKGGKKVPDGTHYNYPQ